LSIGSPNVWGAAAYFCSSNWNLSPGNYFSVAPSRHAKAGGAWYRDYSKNGQLHVNVAHTETRKTDLELLEEVSRDMRKVYHAEWKSVREHLKSQAVVMEMPLTDLSHIVRRTQTLNDFTCKSYLYNVTSYLALEWGKGIQFWCAWVTAMTARLISEHSDLWRKLLATQFIWLTECRIYHLLGQLVLIRHFTSHHLLSSSRTIRTLSLLSTSCLPR
jgi:hypothetical protein